MCGVDSFQTIDLLLVTVASEDRVKNKNDQDDSFLPGLLFKGTGNVPGSILTSNGIGGCCF